MPRSKGARRLIVAIVAAAVAVVAIGYFMEPAQQRAAAKRFGYVPDPEGTRLFLATLNTPFFAEAAAESMDRASGQDTFLYRAILRGHQARYGKPFVVGRQENGSCVAWGAMHAVYCSECIDWELGKSAEPPYMPSTEAIYGGARCEAMGRTFAGWTDGATGFGAAKWLREFGVMYRRPYGEIGVDLTTYDPTLEKNWGAYGCGGQNDRGKADGIAKKVPCRHVVAVRTWDELSAAIEAGFPVTVASNQGFSTHLGEHGIAEASGTWSHQMVCVGICYNRNGSPDDLACILNSWGPRWQTGLENAWPDDLPPGAFWVRRKVIERMLGDAWAIGSVETGFKWRNIHNGKWLGSADQPQAAE